MASRGLLLPRLLELAWALGVRPSLCRSLVLSPVCRVRASPSPGEGGGPGGEQGAELPLLCCRSGHLPRTTAASCHMRLKARGQHSPWGPVAALRSPPPSLRWSQRVPGAPAPPLWGLALPSAAHEGWKLAVEHIVLSGRPGSRSGRGALRGLSKCPWMRCLCFGRSLWLLLGEATREEQQYPQVGAPVGGAMRPALSLRLQLWGVTSCLSAADPLVRSRGHEGRACWLLLWGLPSGRGGVIPS